MPNIRIKDIPTTASATVNGDFFAVDSNASTRKLDAFNPTIGGILTVNGTGTSIFAGNANTSLHVGSAAPYQRAAIGATRRLNYGDVLFSRNLQGQAGTDAYTTIGTDTGSGYSGFEARYGGAARILVGDGATTANAVVTPTVALSATTSSVLVPLATPFVISTGATVPSGAVGVGAVGTGGSFFVNTPSLSDGFGSGLAIDGSYPGGIGAQSVINLKAFGVMSGGNYGSTLTFQTTLNGTFSEVMRINSARNLLIGGTVDNTLGRLQVTGSITASETAGTGLFGFFGGTSLVYGTLASNSVVLRTNNTAALTLDTSQNATFSKDVVLGTSGPSVPSTLSGRAPRQGLNFNRTFGVGVANVTPFGTGDFTAAFWVRRDSSVNQQYLIGNDVTGCFYTGFRVNGNIFSGPTPGTANADLPLGTPTGRLFHLVLVRSAGVLTGYVNAVAGGTAADTNNYTTSASSLFAADSGGSSPLDGFAAVQGFYNRALTQDEVRRLYESGVPAAGDYWSVGANVNVGDPTTGLALTNATITSSTSTSISGINFGANNGQLQIGAGYTSKVGQKVRISFSVTGVTDPNFMYVRWVVNGLEGWYTFANAGITGSSGTFTYDFPTYYAGPQVIQIRNFASFVQNGVNITNFSARTIGLSLAPDAAQSGVNLKWWDISGNLAHITLPANGVSWNVPASGNVAVNGYQGLTLETNASASLRYLDNTVEKWWLYKLSGDANLYLRDMLNARMHVTYSPGNSVINASSNFASNIVCQGTLYVDSTTASVILGKTSGTALNYDIRPIQAGGSIRIRQDSATNDRYIALGRVDNVGAFTESMRVIDQNVLIGTTVNSSALLQVGTDTTNAAGGMLFGSDVNLYRSAANTLRTDDAFQAERVSGDNSAAAILGVLNTSGAGVTNSFGIDARVIVNNSSGTTGSAIGLRSLARVSNASNVGAAIALVAQVDNPGAGTIATAYGLYVNPITVGANNYSIFTEGVAPARFGGNVLVAGTIVDPAITGTILEDIFTITDAAAFEVDPGNGSIQLITLGASRTPKATNFAAGESVTMMIDDGTAFTLTWTDATWGTGGVKWVGGSAPTLATTGYTVIQLWKVGTQIYGARVGDVV